MMTSSNGNIFRVTGPFCGEFTGPGEFPTQRPVTRSFDVYFDLRLNKRLCKQSWGWWFETLLCPLWRHSNGNQGLLSSPVTRASLGRAELTRWLQKHGDVSVRDSRPRRRKIWTLRKTNLLEGHIDPWKMSNFSENSKWDLPKIV